MEWVETTGRTLADAKDAALDQLGVDEQDAEFEVLEEPRAGLFGRMRGEARVRGRVQPRQPRPKIERRERRGRGDGRGRGEGRRNRSSGAGAATASAAKGATSQKAKDRGTTRNDGAQDAGAQPATEAARDTAPAPSAGASRPEPSSPTPSAGASPRKRARRRPQTNEQESTMSETEIAEQGEVVRGFLVDLLDAFDLDGEVTATPAEEGAVELAVTGDDLGLLIGPKGATLQAVQELSRSVLQRQRPGDSHARIRVDVAGYRARRKEALEAFVQGIAEEVRASGTQKALEPMAPPDRKVVHDTVNEIDGVHTASEGEDNRRRVVIIPDA